MSRRNGTTVVAPESAERTMIEPVLVPDIVADTKVDTARSPVRNLYWQIAGFTALSSIAILFLVVRFLFHLNEYSNKRSANDPSQPHSSLDRAQSTRSAFNDIEISPFSPDIDDSVSTSAAPEPRLRPSGFKQPAQAAVDDGDEIAPPVRVAPPTPDKDVPDAVRQKDASDSPSATDDKASANSDTNSKPPGGLAAVLSPPSPIRTTAGRSRSDVEIAPTAPSPAPPTVSIPKIVIPKIVIPDVVVPDPNSAVPIQPQPPAIANPSQPGESIAAISRVRPVTLEQLNITGNTVFSDEALRTVLQTAIDALNLEPAANDETDRPVQNNLTIAELTRLSDAVTQHYVGEGYISSGAYIPESNEAGDVELRVIEGRLGAINVEVQRKGLFKLRPSYITSRLRAATQGPFNLSQLVERVQLLEQDPLVDTITTNIVPGLETGSSTLNVSVVPENGFDVRLGSSTHNSPSVGTFGQQVSVSQANLLGVGDRLSLGFGRTEGSRRWQAGYSVPLNARNGTLSFDYSNSASRIIEDPFDVLDIESKAQTYQLSFRQPLVLTPTESFAFSLTGYHRSNQGAFLETFAGSAQPFRSRGADPDGFTRVSALRFGQDWIKRSPKQVMALQSELSLGLDTLNATINDSQPDSRFLSWRGRGQWTRSLGRDALFLVRGDLQFADRPLVPSEQFGTGGQSSVRGYRPNALLTDNGWRLSSEVRLPVWRVSQVDGVLQIAPFVDLGGGWNNGGFAQPDRSVLSSTGLGLIWQMGDNFDARIDWGVPLTGEEALQDSTLQFEINFTLF